MKNVFELFGFISMACISAAIIFMFMGKKDISAAAAMGDKPNLYSEVAETPGMPKSVTKGIRGNYSSDSGSARRLNNTQESGARASTVAPEERLRALYADGDFVYEAVKKWRSAVSDMADEYNVKPQALLANVLVQSYLGNYTTAQLQQDAARHAGDRVMPAANAAKRYPFAWSVQKVMEQNHLDRYFNEEVHTAAAAVPDRMISAKYATGTKGIATPKVSAPKVVATAKNSPVEEGFRNMVAKEYGFTSWTGLERLAEPEVKNEAEHRVKSMLMASRIK